MLGGIDVVCILLHVDDGGEGDGGTRDRKRETGKKGSGEMEAVEEAPELVRICKFSTNRTKCNALFGHLKAKFKMRTLKLG